MNLVFYRCGFNGLVYNFRFHHFVNIPMWGAFDVNMLQQCTLNNITLLNLPVMSKTGPHKTLETIQTVS